MGLDFFAPRADPAARTRDEQETARARRLATIAPSGLAADKFATIVATPAGEVLHVIPGYLPAQALCDELAFARDLYRSLRDAPAAARPRLVSEAHRARAARLEGAAADPTGVGLRRHVHELLARQPLPPLRAAQPRHFIRHDLVAKELQRFSADLHKVQREG